VSCKLHGYHAAGLHGDHVSLQGDHVGLRGHHMQILHFVTNGVPYSCPLKAHQPRRSAVFVAK